jgi:hypothetical protein
MSGKPTNKHTLKGWCADETNAQYFDRCGLFQPKSMSDILKNKEGYDLESPISNHFVLVESPSRQKISPTDE